MTANEAMNPEPSVILLTGATGYIGGRLLRLLEKQGYPVRGLARRPEVLRQKADASTEVVAGDLLDRASLDTALRGVDAAYYLVHSMGSTGDFAEQDRAAAANFAAAAHAAGAHQVAADRLVTAPVRVVERELSPSDLLVVMKPLDSLFAIRLTRDRAAARDAIERFVGQGVGVVITDRPDLAKAVLGR